MNNKKSSPPVKSPSPEQEPEYTGNAMSFAMLWFGIPLLLVILIAALKVG